MAYGGIIGQVAQALGSVKVETGSYVGTGTYGSNNPTVLQFDAPVKCLMLSRTSAPYQQTNTGMVNYENIITFMFEKDGSFTGAPTDGVTLTVTRTGNSVSFYSTNAYNQQNDNQMQYMYVAIMAAGGES